MARIGLMALGFVLLAPVAMVLRSGGESASITATGLPGATAVLGLDGPEADPSPTTAEIVASTSITLAALLPPDQAAALAAAQAPATTPVTLPPSPVLPTTPAAPLPAPVAATQAPAATVAPAAARPASPAPAASPIPAPAPIASSAAPSITALSAAPASAPEAPAVAVTVADAPTCSRTYEVGSGDYWLGIAKAHQVTLNELLGANDSGPTTAIYPGDDICLPGNAAKPAERATSTTDAPPATTDAPTATTKAPVATTKAPTATTAAPPTTAAPAPRRNYSDAEVQDIIRAVWPDDLEEKALVIADRESGYNPYAKNYCCYGLFQLYWDVHKSWMRAAGIGSASELYDPMVNAYAALLLYERNGGWGPWSQTNHD